MYGFFIHLQKRPQPPFQYQSEAYIDNKELEKCRLRRALTEIHTFYVKFSFHLWVMVEVLLNPPVAEMYIYIYNQRSNPSPYWEVFLHPHHVMNISMGVDTQALCICIYIIQYIGRYKEKLGGWKSPTMVDFSWVSITFGC